MLRQPMNQKVQGTARGGFHLRSKEKERDLLEDPRFARNEKKQLVGQLGGNTKNLKIGMDLTWCMKQRPMWLNAIQKGAG